MKKIQILLFVIALWCVGCSKTEPSQPKKEKVKYDLEIQYSDSSNVIPIN